MYDITIFGKACTKKEARGPREKRELESIKDTPILDWECLFQ